MSKVENVLEYYAIYEKMAEAVPDDANMMAVMRAAELLIADCICQTKINEEVREKTYAHIAKEVRKFAESMIKHKVYEESTPTSEE